jgi:uncharacterized membrane protein YbhN (UPF0104 family)
LINGSLDPDKLAVGDGTSLLLVERCKRGVQTPFRFYLLAVPFLGVVGALPISISGYGVREGLVEYLYSTIHVPTSTALSVVLLMDMQRILFSLLGGVLFLTMENRARTVEAAPVAG